MAFTMPLAASNFFMIILLIILIYNGSRLMTSLPIICYPSAFFCYLVSNQFVVNLHVGQCQCTCTCIFACTAVFHISITINFIITKPRIQAPISIKAVCCQHGDIFKSQTIFEYFLITALYQRGGVKLWSCFETCAAFERRIITGFFKFCSRKCWSYCETCAA